MGPHRGLFGLVALAAALGLPATGTVTAARAQTTAPAKPSASARPGERVSGPVMLTASLSAGWIEGVVSDDRSQPVIGAAVTAQGRDFILAETDDGGRFAIRSVPAGLYVLRVQGRGFAASRREFIQVIAARGTRYDVRLRRASAVADDSAPRVMTAGMSISQVALPPVAEPEPVPLETPPDHDHSDTAWRLRHLKRSVLREATWGLTDAGAGEDLWQEHNRFNPALWALSLGRTAGSLVSSASITGRVQLLTTSTVDQPLHAFTGVDQPAGTAFVNVGGPVNSHTSWSVEAAATPGDVSSWFVAGSYAMVLAESHGIDVRSSYSRQRYEGSNVAALASFADESRNVGGVQVSDRWTLSSRAMLTAGGRYEYYDYLTNPGLFSPSLGVALSPADRTWVKAIVTQQMTAPGAEDFVPQAYGTFALPAQRTFAPLVPNASFARERTRHAGVGVEREVASFLVGGGYFRQSVRDQPVTVFALDISDGGLQRDLGHYSVANGGSFEASGWSLTLSRPLTSRMRGAVEYRMADANWTSVGDADALGRWAPSAVRGMRERIHDLTARVDTELPVTATRVLAVYKISDAYTRNDLDEPAPGVGARFDVQVYQRLPFLEFTRTNWEFVIAVRNLFHAAGEAPTSIYDELLVVRPPTRIVGGVTVQF